jgi:23S rRNA (pseudouridine1915-N3)-methyltransferase
VELTLLAVGRLRPFYREACDEYVRRLGRYARVREIEVREASRAPSLQAQRDEVAARLDAKVPAGSSVIALTRTGTQWSSEELAQQIQRWQIAARPVTLVIGGSHGLSPGFTARSAARWSLGRLTLPHELARVVVVEQLYRGFTILRGEPYHKGHGS